MTEPQINGVPLHVHLEELAKAERERINERFRLEKALIRQEFDKIEQATKLQAGEYKRRLKTLNHAHQEAQRVLNTYLPREAFESYIKDQEVKGSVLKEVLDETKERLDQAVKDLAASVELTRVETTTRLEAQINEIKEAQLRSIGRSEGLSSTGKVVLGAVSVLGFLLALVVLLASHPFS